MTARGSPGVRRVLLVEDDAEDALSTQTMLAEAGLENPELPVVQVECAASLREALQRLKRGAVDLVLLDLALPDSRGLEGLIAVRDAAPGVPVVILTARSDPSLALRAIQAGSQDCLVKAEITPRAIGRTVLYAIERHRVEEALRASEARYRRLVEHLNDALLIDDVNGNIVYANDRFLSLYGVRREDLPGMTLEDYVAPEWSRALRDRHDRRVRGEVVPTEFEYEACRRDGRRFWVEVRVTEVHDERGDIVGTQSVIRDITERRQAQAARSRLVAILDATPDFVVIADPEGQVLYLNWSARRLLGLGPEADLSGLQVADSYPQGVRRGMLDTAIPAARRDGVWQGETTFLTVDGREVPVSLVILAHRREDGQVAFLSTVARDLSEQKALEAQLRQAQKMEAVGRLAGGIAHDFNNLLTAITGYSEMLLLELAGDAELRSQAEEIAAAGARAAALTRQLLAFSRQQEVRREILDLNQVVTGIEKMIRRLIGEDVELSMGLDSGSPLVLADRGQIEQILLNLAVNARDAMPQGGSLALRTAIAEISGNSTAVPPLAPGVYVALEIRDTGHGMDPETKKRIFEPFFTTKPTDKGTGLGLSTVFGIVQGSGGGIDVDSAPGAGTALTVYLPVAEGSEEEERPAGVADEAPAERAAERPGPVTQARLLVVEDEKATGTLIHRLLERQGYRVLTVFSPGEALRLLRDPSQTVDLLLSDVVMPEMSGPQLLEQARRFRPGLAALFMSGYTADRLDDYDLREREILLLQKPFRGEDLFRGVEQALAQAASGRRAGKGGGGDTEL